MSEPSMRRQFLNVIVRHKMAQHLIDIEDEWLDEDDMLDFAKLPGYLQGPAQVMVDNALPVVDALAGIVSSRLM